jgi:hypothetical protein
MLRHPLSARAVVWLVATLLVSLVVAQGMPRIGISPAAVTVGERVTVEGEGLLPNAEHVVTVTAPSGAEVVTSREAGEGGRVEISVTLEEIGLHRVRLRGPTIEALFMVEARAAAPAPAPTPAPAPEPEAAPEPAPEPEPTPEPDPAPAPAEPAPVDPVPADPAPADPAPADPAPQPAPSPLPAPAPEVEPPAEPERSPELVPDDVSPAPADLTGLAVELDADGVTLLEADGTPRWRFERPDGSGGTRDALLHEGRVWIAHGHSVIEVEPERGAVLRRTPLSGPIASLVPSGDGVLATVTVYAGGGTLEVEHRVAEGVADPVATFDPLSPLFTWWPREAEVADPGALVLTDPTNPHLHVRIAAAAATSTEREEHVALALETGSTFFDLAGLARAFAAMGEWEAADEAMRRAMADFGARGYDPGLLTDPGVHERYAFPLRPLRLAVDRADLEAAGFWAPWLVAASGTELTNAGTTLRGYADLLQAAGEREGAAYWREQAARYGPRDARTVLGEAALGLGRGGWYAAVSLLVATLLLHLTLLAKYWRAQGLILRQARESGARIGAAARWRVMRYYDVTEKFVLILLLASAFSVAALAVWSAAGDVAVRAASAGHLEAPFVRPVFDAAATGASGPTGDRWRLALVEGYRAERRGDRAAAFELLERAATRRDPEATRALDTLAGGNRIDAPSRLALREAATGTWTSAVGRAFLDPYGLRGDGIAIPRVAPWAWPMVVTLFLLVAIAHVVMLFVPRPRVARNAPRTLAYHALSVLVPGSGASDELYGVLLLVPTAVFGIDALMQLVGAGSPLGIPLRTSWWILAVLYVVNLGAVAVEFVSYRRRMEALRRDHPDLAYAFGMREPHRAEG